MIDGVSSYWIIKIKATKNDPPQNFIKYELLTFMEVKRDFEVLFKGQQIDQLDPAIPQQLVWLLESENHYSQIVRQFPGFRETDTSSTVANTNIQEATYQHLIERMGERKRLEVNEDYPAKSYNSRITIIPTTLVLLFIAEEGEQAGCTFNTTLATNFPERQYSCRPYGATFALNDNTVMTNHLYILTNAP